MRLRLAPLGSVPPAVIELLTTGLPGFLPVQPVVVYGEEPQWPAGSLPSAVALDSLLRHAGPAPEWWLGISDRPLVDGDGQPVFGEATIGGPAAVLSLPALHTENAASFQHRVLVSALHELGHMAGAPHCADPLCVMYPSRSAAETDAKGPRPCTRCAPLVRSFFARRA
jgi:archaemetzincin